MGRQAAIPEPPFIARRSPPVRHAFELACAAHAGEWRKGDGAPFIAHPLRVAELLDEQGLDDAAVAAALLHDVVENTETSVADVAERFGDEIGELVAAMTEDEAIEDYELRKDAHRDQVGAAGERAVAIYVADKLANLGDMRALYARVGEAAAERFSAPTLDVRVNAWRRDVAMAGRVLGKDFAPLDSLRAELARFEADRASEPRSATA